MWTTLGKWLGKGVLWLARHPQAVDLVIDGVKAAKAAKDDKTPPAPVE